MELGSLPEYVRSCTKIPIPEVLDWSDDGTSIGTEYIIMEHARGVQLHDKWSSMTPHQHMLCVKITTFMMTEMAKLPFPVYGSLYFADAPIDPNLKVAFAEGFCIGPHCATRYWDCNAGQARFYEERLPNRGPWTDIQSYCSGLIDAGFSHIPKVDDPRPELSYRGSIQEHLRLLDISNRVIQELIRKEAAKKRLEKDVLTCRKTFEVVLRGYMRKLHDARAMDPTLLRPIQYCDASWRNSAAALRQELIDLSRHWTALGLLGHCPYQPTPEELAEHAKQYEDFETVQQLKLFLKRALGAESDGWVPANKWTAAKEENARLFAQWVESTKEAGGSENRARALWPFGEVGTLENA
ncbi:hypothetical protein BDV95DRAFT_621421 [Massariosphaeria phaeospora]|uniref:Cellulase n=1 Tax=Massariosphaeria phaeospora TaxID=100035 RepID=A0A7C8M2T2_9PLEO|nr:hypothetical protein BDV95DRAFT_621421 [Massariosphaeria phaeospora]